MSAQRILKFMLIFVPIAFIAKLVRSTLGDSLPAIRLLPALAGTAEILLTGWIARELGGGRFAQGLAALCTLLAPGMLVLSHLFTMNVFEHLLYSWSPKTTNWCFRVFSSWWSRRTRPACTRATPFGKGR